MQHRVPQLVTNQAGFVCMGRVINKDLKKEEEKKLLRLLSIVLVVTACYSDKSLCEKLEGHIQAQRFILKI